MIFIYTILKEPSIETGFSSMNFLHKLFVIGEMKNFATRNRHLNLNKGIISENY